MMWVVENLRLGAFYNEENGPRVFVSLTDATRYRSFDAAMHVVRSNPALDLCVRQL